MGKKTTRGIRKRGILYQMGQILVVLAFFAILLFFQLYYKLEIGLS